MNKKKICAWCHPELKEKGQSHTICPEHYEKMNSPYWTWNPQEKEFQPKRPRCSKNYFEAECENCGRINNAECQEGVEYLEAVEEYKLKKGKPVTY